MEYLIPLLLTIGVSFVILKIVGKSEKINSNKLVYSQSYRHTITKHFFKHPQQTEKKETQLSKRTKENAIKVITIEDKAYWVIDNVFYSANMNGDMPDMSTAAPIDTSGMSKSDIDKMLFILDNLDRGKNNERGSTGNE